MKKIDVLLKELELELLKPEVRKDKKQLDQLLDDDFIEFTSTGLITDKKDVIKRLPKMETVQWKVQNIKIKKLSSDIVLITYKISKRKLKEKIAIWSLRSSIWINNNNNWQIVFHQGTLITKK